MSEALKQQEKSSPAELVLSEDLMEEAACLTSDIAGSFSRSDTDLFLSGLSEALEGCRRIRSLLYLAKDNGLIDEKVSEDLRKQTEQVSSSIKESIKYLSNIEIKKKYRQLEEL